MKLCSGDFVVLWRFSCAVHYWATVNIPVKFIYIFILAKWIVEINNILQNIVSEPVRSVTKIINIMKMLYTYIFKCNTVYPVKI